MAMLTAFFLFLFTFFSNAIANSISSIDKARLTNLSRQLTTASRPLFCRADRAYDIVVLQQRIRIATTCRFGSRTEAEFIALRKECKSLNRKELELRNCVGCSEKQRDALRKKIEEAKEACQMTKVSPSCYNLKNLRAALDGQEARTCPPVNPLVLEAQRAFSMFELSLIARAGLTPSPYTIVTVEPNVPADSVIIMLHGLFQSVQELISYVLDLQKILPSTRFVLPQAPNRYIQLLNRTGPAWFNILSNDFAASEDEKGILESADNIRDIANIQRQVYGMKKVGITGLSQGGAVAMTTYLRHKWDVAVGVATYVPLVFTYPAALTNLSKSAKVLLVHGKEDKSVRFEFAVLSVYGMKIIGRDARLLAYDGEEHQLWNVIGNVAKRVGTFCRKTFDKL